VRGKGGWLDWHPSKTALEWLWRTGQLSVTRRNGFQKVYDLTERVIPDAHRRVTSDPQQMIDWACNSALDHLGFATPGEIAAFWKAVTPTEAREWCKAALAAQQVIEIDVAGASGATRRALARPDVLDLANAAPEPPARLRNLSPFDPALRDRSRTEFLFGFCYRIEVFVPEPKQTFGYYVFPVLEGVRLIARIDVKAHRDVDALRVRAIWPERGITFGAQRLRQLGAELDRLARFAGCTSVEWLDNWHRDAV